jgi:predicted dehydrogenase
MTNKTSGQPTGDRIDERRREMIKATGAGIIAASLGGIAMAGGVRASQGPVKTLRWGIVGTGGIANSMATKIQQAEYAELAAVSSRKMAGAKAFADRHSVPMAFDSWSDMCGFDGVDAIYVATPTSVREEICIAAANRGKHVLGEKPFANLPSVKRIAEACLENGVGFMDGTHFVHHPRTRQIKAMTAEKVGWPWSVASAFQFGLDDKRNIRYNPSLEPYGAIGDAGWYNMRCAVEYCAPGVEIQSVETFMRRDSDTGAAVSGSGVIVFNDGSTTTWNCGFESGAGIMDLRISGARGVIKLDDFLAQRPADAPADYEYRQGWNGSEVIEVETRGRGSVLMFEDFARMVIDPEKIRASIEATSRTQAFLDAVWESALRNEKA